MPTNKKWYWSKNWWANYKKYQWTDKAKKDRAARNKARREAERKGKVRKWDWKHIDHIKPLSKGGSRSTKNTRVVSAKANQRAWAKIANKRKGSWYKLKK